MSAAELVLDGDLYFVLEEGGAFPGDGEYVIEALDGLLSGDAQPIEVVIASLMRDGSIVSKVGDDNRTVSFPVRINASDSLGLALGEQRLDLATGKRTTLAWTPPDGYGPTTVFDVQTSRKSTPEFDILAEYRGERVFQLTLTCLPYGRSVDLISDDAGSPPSSGTLAYNCESTTGWAKWSSTGTYSVDAAIYSQGAGSLRASTTKSTYSEVGGIGQNKYRSYDRVDGLSVSTGAGGYLSISVRLSTSIATTDGLAILWMTTAAGEVEVTSLFPTARDANGFVRYVWPVAAGLTVTGLRFLVQQTRDSYASGTVYTWYDDVELFASATTDYQIVKQIDVKGSARTTASLRVAAPSAAAPLGKVLVITTPAAEIPPGFTPDGRRWITQGTTTVDATSPDGSYLTPDAATYSTAVGKPIFDVPVGGLTPGPYAIVALVKSATSPVVAGVRAQLRVGSTNVGPTSAAEVSVPTTDTGWQFVTVGTVYLPPLPMLSADAATYVRLLFKGALLSNVYMIPAWQKGGRPVADFSIVNCGTGTVGPGLASSSLWIDSPSVTQPQGGWWRGPTADRLNAQSAWPDAKKPGLHTFSPGGLTTFVVSTSAQGPTVTLDYLPAWLGAAAL